MSDELLNCVEIEPARPAERTVLWLHGLGADGHDFEPIVPHLGMPEDLAVRFVFPHAPRIPVTINMGLIMPAWYDIREMDLRREHDMDGVRRSADQVRALIERERDRGVPPERIVLAGFSQGGAIALYLGLRFPERLAGIMALSTYLVGENLAEEAAEANRSTPVFQAHGTHDPMVQVSRGEAARDALVAEGYSVDYRAYPMEHQVHPDEIHDIGEWLRKVLA
ncbi:carboxylesterase [Acidobacteria bacterium Mor1]|nr:carboxylesterase [Acidobacteria bacterium Mor1]